MYKKLVMFLLLSSQLSIGFAEDYSEYDFYYINGMFTPTRTANVENKEMLEQVLRANLGSSLISVETLYNHNNFWLGQLLDVFVEASGELGNPTFETKNFWEMYFKTRPASSPFLVAIRNFSPLLRDFEVGPYSHQDLQNMIARVEGSLSEGKKVIIIPHSQGNFFFKNIISQLDVIEPDKVDSCTASVGLASPLSNTYGNYDWITSTNDVVINGVRALYPHTLASNITIPYSTDVDATGHGIAETYLADRNSVLALKTKIDSAVSYIDNTCREFIPCGSSISASGGTEGLSAPSIKLGSEEGRVTVAFEAYTIPDAFTIRNSGSDELLASTYGPVPGYHRISFQHKPDSDNPAEVYVNLNVVGNSDPDTRWNVEVSCPGESLEDKRVNVTFQIAGEGSNCSANFYIDGTYVRRITAFESGQIFSTKLSAGTHLAELRSFNTSCRISATSADRFSVYHVNGSSNTFLGGFLHPSPTLFSVDE